MLYSVVCVREREREREKLEIVQEWELTVLRSEVGTTKSVAVIMSAYEVVVS